MTKADENAVLDDEAVITVGGPLPRLLSVVALDGLKIRAEWDPETWGHAFDIVDLSTIVARYRVYARLRNDPALFKTVRVQNHRYGIAWGRDEEIDMGASMIADLASRRDP